MTKRMSNKFRICRQTGEDIWGNIEHVNKKVKLEKAPGEHGKTHRKMKDTRYEPKYLTQLREKQKIKRYYGELTEKQFFSIFERGMALKGEVFNNLSSVLERRLDAVVYRMGFTNSIFEARQYINHGHILVNMKSVNISSFQVKDNDVISINENIKNIILEKMSKKQKPLNIAPYVEVDFPLLRGIFLRAPEASEIPYPVNMNMKAIIEYYSR